MEDTFEEYLDGLESENKNALGDFIIRASLFAVQMTVWELMAPAEKKKEFKEGATAARELVDNLIAVGIDPAESVEISPNSSTQIEAFHDGFEENVIEFVKDAKNMKEFLDDNSLDQTFDAFLAHFDIKDEYDEETETDEEQDNEEPDDEE